MSKYYVAINGQQSGPFDQSELLSRGVTASTLVWCEGMPEWQAAGNVAELSYLFMQQPSGGYNQSAGYGQPVGNGFGQQAAGPKEWYAMLNGMQQGPMAKEELQMRGVTATTPVWRAGMADWQEASRVGELAGIFGIGGGYGQHSQPGYGQPNFGQQPYGQQPQTPYGAQPAGVPIQHTDYKTMAIIATVVGALFSCIGLIFGIIAITKANNANRAYAMGDEFSGDQFNSSAKTNSIVAFVFAGIGLIANIAFFAVGIADYL